jgi:ribosomal-protein-alanine N-acetyltransferase
MPTLETKRLRLRNFESQDWTAVWEWSIDPEVRRFMDAQSEDKAKAQAGAKDWVEREGARKDGPDRRVYVFAIVLKHGGEVIGDCQFCLENTPYQPKHGRFHYCISRPNWNRGFATEALNAVLRFGFEELGLHRIQCGVIVENGASLRVQEKLGMRKEALFVQDTCVRGKWYDSFSYAMLGADWKKTQQD